MVEQIRGKYGSIAGHRHRHGVHELAGAAAFISEAGEFNYPTDVAVGSDDTVIVADGYNDRVQVFARDGRFLRKWGGPFAMNVFGPFNGWFATVTSITLDPEGNVFVADFYNNRIHGNCHSARGVK